MRQSWYAAGVALALLGPLLGCGKDEIRNYAAPKEGQAPAAQAPAPVPPPPGMETVEWTLPAGWQERPGEGMRFATMLIPSGSDAPPVELRVTPLALGAGDVLANVNRWREQIGLEHIGREQLAQVARQVEIDGRAVHLVDMTGVAHASEPALRILAAILPGDERAWFFLVMDAPDRVGPHARAFETFVRTVRVPPAAVAEGELPAGHPPLTPAPAAPLAGAGESGMPPAGSTGALPDAGTSSGDLPLRWTTPPGWTEDPRTNPSRLATLHVGTGTSRAEVTITRFPGDVGGLLPNVNRWRGQLGLEPVSDLSQQPLAAVPVDGAQAQMVDLQGPGAAATRQRMLVVLVPRLDFTYFVKMTGPDALVERERDNFTTFARGLRFERGPS